MLEERHKLEGLPDCVTEYIKSVIRRMRYRRGVRREVGRELTDHFVDALADCASEQERNELGEKLVAEFGEAKVLGKLIRRGKKRCRPLWKKATIRSIQATLVGIILCGVYTVWFIEGQPTIRVNYLAKMNQIARPEVAAEQNGWHHLEKAKELYVDYKEIEPDELPRPVYSRNDPNYISAESSKWEFLDDKRTFVSLSAKERERLLKWLKRNEPAWDEFVQIAKKPYCWSEYGHQGQGTSLIGFLPPNLGYLGPLSTIGIWRARKALIQGQKQEAIDACMAILRVGRHWQRKQIILIEQFVGNRICRVGHREILYCLKQSKLSKDELKSLGKQLESLYGDEFPLMDYEAVRLVFMDTVQRVFTEGGPGGGHLIPARFRGFVSYSHGGLVDIYINNIFHVDSYIDCVAHTGRDETVKQGNKLFSLLDKYKGISPYERHVEHLSVNKYLEELPQQKYQFLYIIGPFRDKLLDSGFQTKALQEAVLTILALKQFQIDQGAYPENLKELEKGGYIRQLPDDPYSDEILRYERRGEDFVLYSVGVDFEDDGGREDPEDLWGEREGGRDRVFWPVEFSHE